MVRATLKSGRTATLDPKHGRTKADVEAALASKREALTGSAMPEEIMLDTTDGGWIRIDQIDRLDDDPETST